MKYKLQIKKELIILLMIVAGAAALTILIVMVVKHYSAPTGPVEAADPIHVNKVDSSKLPTMFPADIPLEEGAEVDQNYNATSDDGGTQATRSFVTQKSFDENITIYKEYMQKNGWDIQISKAPDETSRVLVGMKGLSQLQVSMAIVPASQKNFVTISLTTQPN